MVGVVGRRRLDAVSRLVAWLISFGLVAPASAQEHDHAHMNTGTSSGWHLMQDAIVFAAFNRQGGDRGGSELVAPNWWMGMADRETPRGRVTLTGMFSLEPALVGRDGYREIFQVGETLDGKPLVDRQHPHDFAMQLAASWRIPLTDRAGFSVTGALAGEPALGPTAFMHRASAWDNPTAPLGHHTFDSTHISFGVITVALDRPRWTVEGSVFNGREPDDRRWNFDFGRLDSFSGRVWFRPAAEWELQVSTGRLKDPEALEPGNVVRSTASVGWTRARAGNLSAVTAAYGRNDREHGTRSAALIEAARQAGLTTLYGRFEGLQVETALLQARQLAEGPADLTDSVYTFTVGAVRDVFRHAGVDGGFGGDVVVAVAPDSLKAAYGASPVSFHFFFRLRPSTGMEKGMLNMRMGQPMHH